MDVQNLAEPAASAFSSSRLFWGASAMLWNSNPGHHVLLVVSG